jgi:dipeptidyl-peptidase 4
MLWNGMLDWVYPEELDLGTAYWWSPDSKSIAYLQFDVSKEPMYPHADFLPMEPVAEPQRYPKAGQPNADVRLGVVSATGGRTRWMGLGDTRDQLLARVYWAPDSTWLAVFRLNRVQDKLDILRADADTGQARAIIQERDPYWINITDDFQFLKDGSIVWTTERENFRHIYRHRANGAPLARVTSGDWEVTDIACVDESAKKIYYVSSETSPLERNLYVVGFDGKGKQRLTQGAGSHNIAMSPACDYYTDTYSSIDTPTRGALYKSDGTEIMETLKPSRGMADEYDIRPTELHKFKGPDGTEFYGKLIKPSNFDAKKKYPVIVNVYGGPHAQSVRNSWAGGVSWDQVLANKGFVIWQMDNRGSFGRGHNFETPLHRRLGNIELQDQKVGIDYLVGLGFADPKRIGITGWSYGGYMTLYSMLHAPDTFSAGVAGAAVTDFRNYDTIYTERYLGLPAENEEGYNQTAPVNAAKNLKGKLLIIHNIEDDNVLWTNAVQMANALQLAHKPFEMQYYAWKAHGLGGQLRPHYIETATKFFEEALKP